MERVWYDDATKGAYYTFEIDEFRPDDPSLLSSKDVTDLHGTRMESSGFAYGGQYMNPREGCNLSVTGTKLEITPDMASSIPYERSDSARALHNYEPLLDYFGDEVGGPKEMIGKWTSELPLSAIYIEFMDKGLVDILLQKQDEPMQFHHGFWKVREDGTVFILTERAGWGDMPYEFNLSWELKDGNLVLADVNDDEKLLPVYNSMTFTPMADGWVFPDFAANRTYDDSLLWEFFNDEGTYKDQFDTQWEYSFYAPMLTATTPEANRINDEIRQNCGEKVFQAYEDMEQKYGLNFYDIHWDSYCAHGTAHSCTGVCVKRVQHTRECG